jgi:hypothetical protein
VGRPALRATAGCVGQATARVKLLLPNGKGKLPVTVAAIQRLINHKKLSFFPGTLHQLPDHFSTSVLRNITQIDFSHA